MAASMEQSFVKYFALFLLFLYTVTVRAQCPQQPEGSESTNQKARTLAGLGTFYAHTDKNDPYLYEINLCQTGNILVAIRQTNQTSKQSYVVGRFKGARVFGGTDWLVIQYLGDNYHPHHCGGAKRKGIIYIQCDRSANTHEKRTPKVIEEYRPDKPNKEDEKFCYYLFVMKHDGICPPSSGKNSLPWSKKISPGSFIIFIVVIVGVLYLALGFLYQRFIVGATGKRQIPNYLMWRQFCSLQADGWNYVCRCKETRQPTHYNPVDDAIADDEDLVAYKDDNDDTMLPM